MNLQVPFTRENPFFAKLKERKLLCRPHSTKETFHLVLDLGNSGITYSVGDSIAILPSNDPLLVQRMLAALKMAGTEPVVDRKGNMYPLSVFLTEHVNLKGVTKKLIQILAGRISEKSAAPLQHLLKEENKAELKEWLHTHELWDLLEGYPEAHFTPQEFAEHVMPLLPRFYSIASAQSFVGNEVHLLISYLKYESSGHCRIGACTHYLCHLAPLDLPVVPLYLHPAHEFHLPENKSAPIIMVGPGTGVAPFRSFIQERIVKQHTGKNWLFFGERTKVSEFFYEEEWLEWVSKGVLKLTTAFSRDQEQKIYVQHQMRAHGKELFSWLQQGAYFYVCGDAHHMAKDVDQALHAIVEEHGQMGEEDAKAFVKALRKEKRYLRDVY